MVTGADPGAPILLNLLRMIAQSIRANSSIFARSGARSLGPAEAQARQQAIEAQADVLDRIADCGLDAAIDRQLEIEATFKRLLDLGTRAPDDLVSGVAHALTIFEKRARPRIDGPNFVLDYKGYQISWPRTPMSTASIAVEVTAEIMSLFGELTADNFQLWPPARKRASDEPRRILIASLKAGHLPLSGPGYLGRLLDSLLRRRTEQRLSILVGRKFASELTNQCGMRFGCNQ